MSGQKKPGDEGEGQRRATMGQVPAQGARAPAAPRRPTGGHQPAFGEDAPRRPTVGQMPAVGAAPARRPTVGQMPALSGGPTATSAPRRTTTGQLPERPGGATASGEVTDPLAPQKPPATMTTHQKQSLGSAFQDAEGARQRSAMLGDGQAVRRAPEESGPRVTTRFRGDAAPPELQGRDVWKAVLAPAQSREGRRSRAALEQVVHQFAVATNPRYVEDAPGRPRAHIFVWDVSRAMGCEVPHFLGAKELTLAQTCDWLRHEGPMRGWRKLGELLVLEAVDAGQLVIAMPRDIKLKLMAVAAPQPPPADGKPRLTGAALRRGVGLTNLECFGVRPLEYFVHA